MILYGWAYATVTYGNRALEVVKCYPCKVTFSDGAT